MKKINNISRSEKILLLKAIERGEICSSELTPDTFVLEVSGDPFLLGMINASRIKRGKEPANGIIIDSENKSILKNEVKELSKLAIL